MLPQSIVQIVPDAALLGVGNLQQFLLQAARFGFILLGAAAPN